MNQDVGLDDPCWQCGTILSAPVSALETGVGPPTSEANPANATGSSSAPIQRQIERDQPTGSVPSADRPRSSFNLGLAAVAIIVLAVIVILVVVVLNQRH